MEKFHTLKEVLLNSEKEAVAFYEKGNKAAGTRLRNALQQLKVLATDIRKDVTDIKNSGK